MKQILYDTFEEYLAALKENGINKLVFAETDEQRPWEVEPNVLMVQRVCKLELLAYKNSVIYKFFMENPDFETIHARLVELGFELSRVNRNIT